VRGENFADKWNDYPQQRRKFIGWYERIARDLEGARGERGGAPAVHERLKQAFGADPVTKAIGVIGEQSRRLRETGGLRVATGGTADRRRRAAGAGPQVLRWLHPGVGRSPSRSRHGRCAPATRTCRRPLVQSGRLTWCVKLQPTPLSVRRAVRLSYHRGQRPRVTVVDPPLERRPGEPLPHVFPGDELCLFYDKFVSGRHLIADTVVCRASASGCSTTSPG
jgi:hypothetical protein